jgi:hypothetical protein
MKKNLLLLSLASLLWFASACDKVEGPFSEGTSNGNNPDTTQTFFRKILIDEFTGHKCGECPYAARTLKQIQELYGDKVVAIAIHAGNFATPNQNGPMVYDFRSPEGNQLDQFFENSAAGLPNGLVNRISNGGTSIVSPTDWSTRVTNLINQPADAWLTIDLDFVSDTRVLNASVETKFLQSVEDSLNIALYVLEDSIQRPQVIYNDPNYPNSFIENYHHRHVLRGSMNGAWGNALATGQTFTNGQLITTTGNITLPSNWNAEQVSVVAVVYKAITKEVVQVEEKKL